MIPVSDQHIVSLRFVMKDASGHLLEDNLNTAPIRYLQGGHQILRELQVQLEGMTAGEQRQVELVLPDTPPRRFSFDVYVDAVRPATEQEVRVGYPLVQEDQCGPDCSC